MDQSPRTRSLSPEDQRPAALELSAKREKGFVGEALLTATGLALAGYGLLRRSTRGTLLMAAGTLMGALGARRLRGRASTRPSGTARSLTVLASRHEVYRMWRDFSSLPRFMQHIERIEALGEGRHRWHLRIGPKVRPIEWETRIVEDREGELIAWESTEESPIETRGRIELLDAPGNRGTEVHATITYRLRPGRGLGSTAAHLLEPLIAHEVKEDLRRFKQLVETGIVPGTSGQPSGRERDAFGPDQAEVSRESSAEVRA